MTKPDGRDALALLGLLAVVNGVRLVSEAGAWVVGGLLLLAAWSMPYLRAYRRKG
jgi:hypothetical protein